MSEPELKPEGRLIAIGDLHGYASALERMLAGLALQQTDRVVFLGDYIDRGPDVYGTIARLMALQQELPGARFLRGNHDQWLLNWLFGGDDTFLYVGGRQTLASYAREAGVDPEGTDLEDPALALEIIPRAHLKFIEGTLLFFDAPECLFVHGGINPLVPEMERQAPYDLLMSHPLFFKHSSYPKPVVVGHTSTQIFRRSTPVFMANGIVMCDTSFYVTGALSAVEPTARHCHQVLCSRPEACDEDGAKWEFRSFSSEPKC